MRLLALFLFVLPQIALAETVQITGPSGPLQAEQIAVDGAKHALVIVPGSGPIDRDGNAPTMGLASDTYKRLAEGMATRGVASVRIDKRGFFGSAAAIADPNDVTIEAYAQDTRNWVAHAAALAPCVWIAGHSEGGLVALVAAQNAPDALCGLILLASPGRPLGQLMIAQFERNPANAPLMDELRATITDLEAGQTRQPSEISPFLQPLFTPGLQRYMMNLFSFDPAEVAAKVRVPFLIVQGDQDIQIGLDNADLLANALSNAQQVTLLGGTHMLKEAVEGDPFATYRDATLPLHDGLLDGIADYLARHP